MRDSQGMPHDIEVEQAVLGAILLSNDVIDTLDNLRPEHFFEQLHGHIFGIACKMIQSGHQATPLTLAPFFADHPTIGEHLTVKQYLGRLAVNGATPRQVAQLAQDLRHFAIRRALVMMGEELQSAARDTIGGANANELVEDIERYLCGLVENANDDRSLMFADALEQAVTASSAAYQRGGGLVGLSTGFKDLDAKLGGLQNSDLIILAGRPSMGKTALATNIAVRVAKAGGPVDFYSLEMAGSQLAMRVMGEHGEVPSDRLRRGAISEDEFRKVFREVTKMKDLPISINERGGLTIGQLAARARRMKRKHKTALLIVDYLQLLQGSNRHSNRVQDITEITVGLKALAKELNIPIIALSQLSRAVESRPDKRPQLSDLRESGSIEQDADVVVFVYREEYYLERTEPPDPLTFPGQSKAEFQEAKDLHDAWEHKMEHAKGKAEAILAKSRHGPTGIVTLTFQSEFTRFSDFVHSVSPPVFNR